MRASADDSWMNDKTSSQLDISGNIRVIDLKVEGREIAVQISDEATDRAERFKGELADGSPLPSWVKVDRDTGLTTADPPPGAQPFEMRVVAEDGGGNTRAIDLVLDPTSIEGEGEADRKPTISWRQIRPNCPGHYCGQPADAAHYTEARQ